MKKFNKVMPLFLAVAMLGSGAVAAAKPCGHIIADGSDRITEDGVEYHVHGASCFAGGTAVCGYEEALPHHICELPCLTTEEQTRKIREVTAAVEAGTGPYVYSYITAYQASPHMGLRGQRDLNTWSFLLADTSAEECADGTWTADGTLYTPGVSNYAVAYCCDVETSITDAQYRRVNLEDAAYYSKETAEKIRGMVLRSYPFVSLEEMRSDLVAAGVMSAEEARLVDEADLTTAVQLAIWTYANHSSSETQGITWGQTYRRGESYSYVPCITAHNPANTKDDYIYPQVQRRIAQVVSYLTSLPPVAAESGDVVISTVTVDGIRMAGERTHGILQVGLNTGCDEDDEVTVTACNVTTGDTASAKVGNTPTLELTLPIAVGDEITVTVAGVQQLERGVYFYEPEPADKNGDGEATPRETSQNLVGVAAGAVPVGDSYTLSVTEDLITEESQKTNPETGDGVLLWGGAAALSFASGAVWVYQKRKR